MRERTHEGLITRRPELGAPKESIGKEGATPSRCGDTADIEDVEEHSVVRPVAVVSGQAIDARRPSKLERKVVHLGAVPMSRCERSCCPPGRLDTAAGVPTSPAGPSGGERHALSRNHEE